VDLDRVVAAGPGRAFTQETSPTLRHLNGHGSDGPLAEMSEPIAQDSNMRSLENVPCQPWYQTAPVEAFTESIPAVLPLRVVSSV